MSFGNTEDIGTWKWKHSIVVAVEEAMYLSQDRLHNELWNLNICIFRQDTTLSFDCLTANEIIF
jgi:hypothetical protein